MNAKQNPDAKTLWQMDKDHFIHPYTDYSTFEKEGSQVITGADGVHVTDSEGKRYLDGIAGLWCVNIGHGRQEMADAIAEQVVAMQYYNPFGHSTNEPAARLASKLAALAPGDLNHIFYSCGGSTANDTALRLVHFYNNLRGALLNKSECATIQPIWHSIYSTLTDIGIPRPVILFNTRTETAASVFC